MPRPATCSIVRRATKRGISYSLRVSYNGERPYVQLGGEWEGWDDERAEQERVHVARQLERGEWRPPVAPAPARSARAPGAAEAGETFLVTASRYFDSQSPRLSDAGRVDLEWRLRVAIGHLGAIPTTEISEGDVDDMVTALLQERERIERAAARGKPLTEKRTHPKTGTVYERRISGLSNSSINKVVAAVQRVMEDQRRHRVVSHVPVDRSSRVKQSQPSRSFLQVFQAIALLNAATEIERRHRGLTWDDVVAIRRATNTTNVALSREYNVSETTIRKIRKREVWVERPPDRRYNDVPRRVILLLLVTSGVRVAEACGMDGRHLNFPARQIEITRDITKSDAGVRIIPMLPIVHTALLEHRARYRFGSDDPVFLTRRGTRQTPGNVRSKIVAPALEEANKILAKHDLPTIRHCTPHTFRRTFASVLAELGVPPRRTMRLLGHTDPDLTMRVYQQVLDMNEAAWSALPQLLGCETKEALRLMSGRSGDTDTAYEMSTASPLTLSEAD